MRLKHSKFVLLVLFLDTFFWTFPVRDCTKLLRAFSEPNLFPAAAAATAPKRLDNLFPLLGATDMAAAALVFTRSENDLNLKVFSAAAELLVLLAAVSNEECSNFGLAFFFRSSN